MSNLLLIILLFIVIFIIYIRFKKNIIHIKNDTIIGFTGGLGSGKTFLSVITASRLYLKNLKKVKLYNLFHKNDKLPLPKLFSNIPILIKGKWCYRLTSDILLLQTKIPEYSVILIDEIGSFASQFDYNNINIKGAFDEFIRFFRHYVDGYIICNDQNKANIELHIRRRINTIYNLDHFSSLLHIYTITARQINLLDDDKSFIDPDDKRRFIIGLLPIHKQYDSRCYSCRYNSVPSNTFSSFLDSKTNSLLKCPNIPISSKTGGEKNV